MSALDNQQKEKLESAFKQWTSSLVDLTNRNRLINFKLYGRSNVVIVGPDVDELYSEARRASGWNFYFPAEPEAEVESRPELEPEVSASEFDLITSESDPNQLRRKLLNLARRSREIYDERALRVLHLAVGGMTWNAPGSNESVRSPLLFVPVELFREGPDFEYELRFVDDDPIVNPALRIKLEKELGHEMPDDWDFEDKPLSQELAEIEKFAKKHDWSVDHRVELAILQFQKMAIYEDLQSNKAEVLDDPTVQCIVLGAGERSAGPGAAQESDTPQISSIDSVSALDSMTILDADASQMQCVLMARTGRSFVIQGPPGTGKSQTIANVIADQISRGKSVLFVSEKIAALEVVQKRLSSRGLERYLLPLHSDKVKRKSVVEELSDALESEPKVARDSKKWTSGKYESSRSSMNKLVEELHVPRAELLGRSAFEVNGDLIALEDAPDIGGAPQGFAATGTQGAGELERIASGFEALSATWDAPFSLARTWDGLTRTDATAHEKSELSQKLNRALAGVEGLAALRGQLVTRLGIRSGEFRDELLGVADCLTTYASAPTGIDASWMELDHWTAVSAALRESESSYAELAAVTEELRPGFPSIFSDPPVKPPLEELAASLRALDAKWTVSDSDIDPFVGRIELVRDASKRTLSAAEEFATAFDALCSEFGLDAASRDFDQARRLGAAASRIFTSPAPLSEILLTTVGLESCIQSVHRFRKSVENAQTYRADLMARYDDAFLTFEPATLLPQLDEAASSWAKRAFGSDFKNAKRTLLTHLKSDSFDLDEARSDLRTLAEFQAELQRLDVERPEAQDLLGAQFDGVNTDLAKIDRSVSLAGDLIEILGTDLEPARSALISLASKPAGERIVAVERTEAFEIRAAALDAAIVELSPHIENFGLGGVDSSEAIVALATELQRDLSGLTSCRDAVANTEGRFILSMPQLDKAATDIRRWFELGSYVSAAENRWPQIIGKKFAGRETDWALCREHAEWIDGLKQTPGAWPPPRLSRELIGTRDASTFRDLAEQCSSVRSEFDSATDSLLAEFSKSDQCIASGNENLAGHSLLETLKSGESEASRSILELRDAFDHLDDWMQFRRALKSVAELGWKGFAENLVAAETRSSRIDGAWRKAFWTRRLESVLAGTKVLRDFDGESREKAIKKFADLDRSLIASAPTEVVASLAKSAPSSLVWDGSEKNLLMREARKRSRHLSVRRLLQQIPTLLPQIKPCLMMSPLTVSTFLNSKQRFDVVIFDEASQVKPEDAINCIYRGSQLIVAGDDKQLPPTSFFDASADGLADGGDDGQAVLLESLLDECQTQFANSLPLKWHYRSRDENLIAFSNTNFYRSRLITFPASRVESPSYGVKFHFCEDGVYDRGGSATNRNEARAVADRAAEVLMSGETSSLGIVALSSKQALAIEEELDQIRIAHPSIEHFFSNDRLDSVFVKNLESVQGDERDVIILCVGYGPDATGVFHKNFGPLNNSGGERRLNVAITRAKKRIEVVASIRHSDIDFSESESAGARVLRSYLEYAEIGPSVLQRSRVDSAEPESPFEEEVAGELRSRGFDVKHQVGVSSYRIDLGIIDPANPSRFLAGVECDGASYHSAPTARERDRLREDVLRDQGWNIFRIWSTDWMRNRTREVERLVAQLNSVGPEEPRVSPASEPVGVEFTKRRLQEQAPGKTYLARWFMSAPIPVDELTYELIEVHCLRLLEEFGGIHDQEKFIVTLARSFGHKRTSRQLRLRLIDGIEGAGLDLDAADSESEPSISEPGMSTPPEPKTSRSTEVPVNKAMTIDEEATVGHASIVPAALALNSGDSVEGGSGLEGEVPDETRDLLNRLQQHESKKTIGEATGRTSWEVGRAIRALGEQFGDPQMKRAQIVQEARRRGLI